MRMHHMFVCILQDGVVANSRRCLDTVRTNSTEFYK